MAERTSFDGATTRSVHMGGVFVAMCDGSVQFISEDIETGGAMGACCKAWDHLMLSQDGGALTVTGGTGRPPGGPDQSLPCCTSVSFPLMAASMISQRTHLLILTGLVVAFVGCGSRQSYDVSGVAQYQDGSPITGAVRIVRLEPTDDTTATIRKAASGYLAEDGTFEMFTRRPGDGVIPGQVLGHLHRDGQSDGRQIADPVQVHQRGHVGIRTRRRRR